MWGVRPEAQANWQGGAARGPRRAVPQRRLDVAVERAEGKTHVKD
jgi:hypothetical protein